MNCDRQPKYGVEGRKSRSFGLNDKVFIDC